MTLSNKELKVEDLIKNAEEEEYWLPEFQRPYVWDKNQVRLLIDSLFQDYTISSILLWKGGDELARRRVGGNFREIIIPQDNDEEVTYLLDGQQRATSLLLSFTEKAVYKGTNIRKQEKIEIYWDSEYAGDDPESRWVYEDDKIVNPVNDEEMVQLRDYGEKELFKVFNTRYVKIKHSYFFNEAEAKEWFDDDFEKLYYYREKLINIKDRILKRRVHDIEQKGNLEQVLEVFERINTKNTKLSIFDIMVAKTYRKIGDRYFDLRSYYKLINYDKNVDQDYFKNLDRIDLEKVKKISDEVDLLSLTTIMLLKEFKSTEILKLNTHLLMSNTKYLHDNFHLLVDFMNQHFGIGSGELRKFHPLMKFLAAALTIFKDVDVKTQNFLKAWFWNTLIFNRYPGSQNERIDRDYQLLDGKGSLESIMNKMLRDNTRNFNHIASSTITKPEFIDAYYSSRSQQIYNAMLLLLKSQNAKDFYSGLKPQKTGSSSLKLEEHHIFPKNSNIGKATTKEYEDHRYNDIINNIANIALITKETNNSRIGSKNPSEYITAFQNEYKAAGKEKDFLDIMASQFIDQSMIEMLKNDDFDGFIFSRTQLIIAKINELCLFNGASTEVTDSINNNSQSTFLKDKPANVVSKGNNSKLNIIAIENTKLSEISKPEKLSNAKPWLKNGKEYHFNKITEMSTKKRLSELIKVVQKNMSVDGPFWNQKDYITFEIAGRRWLRIFTKVNSLELKFNVKTEVFSPEPLANSIGVEVYQKNNSMAENELINSLYVYKKNSKADRIDIKIKTNFNFDDASFIRIMKDAFNEFHY